MLAHHDPAAASDPDRLFRFGYGPATLRSYVRQRAVVACASSHDAPDSLLVGLTFTQNERLADIAAAAGVSVFHLCRTFKALSGWTLHQYRNQLRLHTSLELLADTHDILAVAVALGYSGHSHFTAAFRRAFGVTPSEWRARRAL